jgi:hypothetical protein
MNKKKVTVAQLMSGRQHIKYLKHNQNCGTTPFMKLKVLKMDSKFSKTFLSTIFSQQNVSLIRIWYFGALFKKENLYCMLPPQEFRSPPNELTKKGKEKKNYV